MCKHFTLLFALVFLAGCFNVDNAQEIHFGDVSIGQQMIDLQRALDEDAITADEYSDLKAALMSLRSGRDDDEEEDE